MPRGDPFSLLCQQTCELARGVAADLHIHTTASDGECTLSQILAHARQARLEAIAITDHDILPAESAKEHSQDASIISGVRVMPGIECSVRWRDQEVHLLGYGIQTVSPAFSSWMDVIRESRAGRFRAMIAALHERGVGFPDGRVEAVVHGSAILGRRHVVRLLVQCGIARHRHDAFQRYLNPIGAGIPGKALADWQDAVDWIHSGGGVCSLAHPRQDWTEEEFQRFKDRGLDAVEVSFPACSAGRSAELRGICDRLALGQTAGSDFHGGEGAVGSHGLNTQEFNAFPATRLRRTHPTREPS